MNENEEIENELRELADLTWQISLGKHPNLVRDWVADPVKVLQYLVEAVTKAKSTAEVATIARVLIEECILLVKIRHEAKPWEPFNQNIAGAEPREDNE